MTHLKPNPLWSEAQSQRAKTIRDLVAEHRLVGPIPMVFSATIVERRSGDLEVGVTALASTRDRDAGSSSSVQSTRSFVVSRECDSRYVTQLVCREIERLAADLWNHEFHEFFQRRGVRVRDPHDARTWESRVSPRLSGLDRSLLIVDDPHDRRQDPHHARKWAEMMDLRMRDLTLRDGDKEWIIDLARQLGEDV